MELRELWRYPVKSMAGERLDQTTLGLEGIPGDRVVHVVDPRGRSSISTAGSTARSLSTPRSYIRVP